MKATFTYKRLIPALFLLLLSSAGFGQSILRVSPTGISGLPDTVHYGDTLKNMTVTVLNDGPLPVLGVLLNVQSQFNGVSPVSSLGNLLISTITPLFPGDSVVVPLDYFVVTPQNSNTGSNIVVVWPASATTQPGDSVEDSYYVDDAVAILEAGTKDYTVNAYPNPVKNNLRLTFDQGHLEGMEVELRNTKGVLVYREQAQKELLIDMGQLPSGLYLLRVSGPEGSPSTLKVLKN